MGKDGAELDLKIYTINNVKGCAAKDMDCYNSGFSDRRVQMFVSTERNGEQVKFKEVTLDISDGHIFDSKNLPLIKSTLKAVGVDTGAYNFGQLTKLAN